MGRGAPVVGIPRALLYHRYHEPWRAFFEALGARVVVSPPTDRATLDQGSRRLVADTCLPVKAYMGHVAALAGRCDHVFVPCVRSVRPGTHNCAKLLGLADLVRAAVPEVPALIDPDIDGARGARTLHAAARRAARPLTGNPLRIERALRLALRHVCEPLEVGDASEWAGGGGPVVAVVGHAYLLFDDYLSHRLLHILIRLRASVRTPRHLTVDEKRTGLEGLACAPYWAYEDEILGAGGHFLHSEVDGVVAVSALGCGPDSLMMEVLRRHARALGKPFMCLVLDEHTSQGGLLTRLEAFLDMLQRKRPRRHGGTLRSAPGDLVHMER